MVVLNVCMEWPTRARVGCVCGIIARCRARQCRNHVHEYGRNDQTTARRGQQCHIHSMIIEEMVHAAHAHEKWCIRGMNEAEMVHSAHAYGMVVAQNLRVHRES